MSDMQERLGETLAGKYRLVRKLGAGGMGVVFLAEQAPLGREVVVKLVKRSDEDLLRRFEKEAQLVSRLTHPHVVSVYDYGATDDGELFLVMEHLTGRSLRDQVADRKPACAWAAQRVLQIALALEAAHLEGIAHRDLTPNNVFLVDRGQLRDFVKVLDFGLAKRVESGDEPPDAITNTGELLGTPGYMSPEQIEGERGDARSDVYALGVIWYQLVTGDNPFRAETSVQTLMRHLDVKPEAPSALGFKMPAEHERLLMRMLAKDPGLRPAMGDIVSALQGSASMSESTTRPVDEVEAARLERARMQRHQRARKSFLAVSCAALVALVAGAWTGVDQPTRRVWSPPVPRGSLTALKPFPGIEDATVALGSALYQSPTMSAPDADVSCATCHPVSGYGTTHESRTRFGVGGAEGKLPDYNTPSCVVAALQFRQQWRAGTATLEDIVDVPLFNPILMNAAGGKKDWGPVLARVRKDPELIDRFAAAGREISAANVRSAIASYMRTLIPLDTPLDRKLEGKGELSDDADEGMERFQRLGCVSCHQGRALGGNMVARFGVMTDAPYAGRGVCERDKETRCRSDLGCAEHQLGKCLDYGEPKPGDGGIDGLRMFKVPSLRNVIYTAPYFHDGSAHTLDVAIRTMGELQLGVKLTDVDVRTIKAFLTAASAEAIP